MQVEIEFTDGTAKTIAGYRTRVENGVLSVRTSHDTAYNDIWENFPLANIKTWKTA
jgi:hypothetical protein